jgi:nitronate monooxygenase
MGLLVPIANAPMGGVAGGALAAAVSAAGGLGMIGVGSAGSVGLLERESGVPREMGARFGIGLIDWAIQRDPGLLRAAIAAHPVLLSVSFGDDWSWAEQASEAGIVTAAQVYDGDEARRAADAGIEVVVARGAEGGGHGKATVATLPLLEAVLDAVTVPVLAAGGISTSRGLAAVLAAGASGVWLGTAFAACPESLASDGARWALLKASGRDTVMTSVFDAALGYPWPPEYPERVLCNEFTRRWSGREEEVASNGEARAALTAAISDNDFTIAPVNAGQGVGLLTEIRPAKEVLEYFCAGAAELLRTR